MKNLYFLFPAMNIQSGGHVAQIKLLEIAKTLAPSFAVTYETRYQDLLFLDDLLKGSDAEDGIFFLHWGPHVPGLIQRLEGKNVVYVAYSTGYAFSLPPGVPILAVSRHTMAYWGRHAPGSPIYHLPPEISPEFTNHHRKRDIDILVQKRKSSRYLLDELVPLLSRRSKVVVLDSWLSSLEESEIFNRSKVYLYDSVEYWYNNGLSEGFGLPPLEALACGCVVFSSVNDALSDYLDPGFNCFQIRSISAEYDAERILKAVREWQDAPSEPSLLHFYRRGAIQGRFKQILMYLEEYFAARKTFPASTAELVLSPPSLREAQLVHQLNTMQKSRAWKLANVFRRIYNFFFRK